MVALIARSLETGGAGFGLAAVVVLWFLAESLFPRAKVRKEGGYIGRHTTD